VLPYGQKLTLGLLATNTLNVVPFRACTQFPLFKSILKVVLFEGVQQRLPSCLDHLNYVKVAVSAIMETEKIRKGESQMSRVGGMSYCS
jgi:hypothetical protein